MGSFVTLLRKCVCVFFFCSFILANGWMDVNDIKFVTYRCNVYVWGAADVRIPL